MIIKTSTIRNNNAGNNKITCPRCGAKFNPDKGLDLAGLAAMINEGKDANRKEQKPDWAKNSRYYGTDICGYAYNPYMVRRWITAQFLELMNSYNLKIEDGIRHEYNYMYSIDYVIKEAKRWLCWKREIQLLLKKGNGFGLRRIWRSYSLTI